VAYGIEHIPAAINLPHRTLSNAVVRQLDTNKSMYVIAMALAATCPPKARFVSQRLALKWWN
ncbi:MAG: hypothetical protein CMQ22_07745, partial [Gammaproteobacteria bacterium]|nr:hypothetical protein [Gammaproteobacteria bacterium]